MGDSPLSRRAWGRLEDRVVVGVSHIPTLRKEEVAPGGQATAPLIHITDSG